MRVPRTSPEDPISGRFYASPRSLRVGDRVGPYTLTEHIGTGGFGQVYRAEQREPFEREVALKVMHRVTDAHRLKDEGQALALMEHPGVATVYDAGITDDGVPFVAMELVDGEHITRYCTDRRLTVRARLELFVQVCRAVHHAHQKAIIHRDIKPSNVIVSEVDGRPVVKVIDFGIAVIAGGGESDGAEAQPGLMGTPQYMSPEQLELPLYELDVRTDVYALGVLLYELLVDERPFDVTSLHQGEPDDVRRIIRELIPATPAQRLRSTPVERLGTVARNHGTTPAALCRRVGGDLSWITSKALAKERADRYGSASELAEEVERHLKHLPVAVVPASPWYRLRKLARRRRGSVAATGVAVIGVVVGLGVAIWQAVDANVARHEAQVSEAFLEGVLTAASPLIDQGENRTLRDVVLAAVAEIERDPPELPAVDARIRHTLGRTLFSIGEYEESGVLLRQAYATRTRLYGSDDDRTLEVANSLALTLWYLQDTDEAEQLLRDALATRRARHGEDDPATLTSMHNLGSFLVEVGDPDEAVQLLETVRTRRESVLGTTDPATIQTTIVLAQVYRTRNQLVDSLKLSRVIVDRCRVDRGENDPITLAARLQLARVLLDLREYPEALEHTGDASRRSEEVFGRDHLETIAAFDMHADALHSAGRYTDAEAVHRENLAILIRDWGSKYPRVMRTQNDLALTVQEQGRMEEAEAIYETTLAAQREVLGPEHRDTIKTLNNLATLMDQTSRDEQALPIYQELLAIEERVLGSDHSMTLKTLNNLASVLTDLDKLEEAITIYDDLIRTYEENLGPDSSDALFARYNRASALNLLGRTAEARDEYAALLARYRAMNSPIDIYWTLNSLGRMTYLLDDPVTAAAQLREAIEIARKLDAPPYQLAVFESNLGVCLVDLGAFEEAERLLLEAYEALTRPGLEIQRERAAAGLVRLYESTGRPEQAAPYRAAEDEP